MSYKTIKNLKIPAGRKANDVKRHKFHKKSADFLHPILKKKNPCAALWKVSFKVFWSPLFIPLGCGRMITKEMLLWKLQPTESLVKSSRFLWEFHGPARQPCKPQEEKQTEGLALVGWPELCLAKGRSRLASKLGFFFFFFFKFFDRQKEIKTHTHTRERETERESSIYLFTPRTPTTAGLGQAKARNLEINPSLPCGWQGSR